jgi:hypothetical protein
MTGLVEQLQSDAIDPAVPVSTLLRKVKVAAVKLGLNDALEWVEHELGGYRSDLPAYRQGHGSTVGFNPYHGWQPVHFRDASAADLISTVYFYEPIANYEALLDKDGPFTLPIPNHLVSKLNETFKFDVPRMANEVPRGLIVQVVQHVRDMVLDWALELARAGVTGDGLGFSNDERVRANSAHISIGTFQGSFNTGSVNGENARINQASSDQSTNVVNSGNVFSEVRLALQGASLSPEKMKEVDTLLFEMSVAKDKTSFAKAYQSFVGAIADHITVVAPFLPQITELLSKLV